MSVETWIYNSRFFKNTIKLEAASAVQFVKIVLKYYQPQSIVDIGCGTGLYLREFANQGITDFLGIDGAPAAQTEFLLVKNKIVIFDLSQEYQFSKKYDLALCLEVAEHLPAQNADTLIKTITKSADEIIFTAATPGQGPRSIGHLNEQTHQYWIKKFQDQGFSHLPDRSKKMRKELKANNVIWWLVDNLMLFKKKSF